MFFPESSVRTIRRSQELLLSKCPKGSDAYAYFNHQALIAMHSSLSLEQFLIAKTVIILAMMSHEEVSMTYDDDFLRKSSHVSLYDKAKRSVSYMAWIIVRDLDEYENLYYQKDEIPLNPAQYAEIYLNFHRLRIKIQDCSNRDEAFKLLESEAVSIGFDQIGDIEEITIMKFAILMTFIYIQTGRFLTPEQDHDLFSHPKYFYRYTLQRLGRRSNRILQRIDLNFIKSMIIRNKPTALRSEMYIAALKSRFHRNISKRAKSHGLGTALLDEIHLVEQALFEARFDLLEEERLRLEQRFAYFCTGDT